MRGLDGLDDILSSPKQNSVAETFDAFANFGDIALPEVPAPVQVESKPSSGFSTPPSTPPPLSTAGGLSWGDLRKLAAGLVDLNHEERVASLSSMDSVTRERMLVVMQENWEDYGFARHTMALCTLFSVQPSPAFQTLCAQENSVVDAPMSRDSSASSFSSVPYTAHNRRSDTAPSAKFKLANQSVDDMPEGILPPGFQRPRDGPTRRHQTSTEATAYDAGSHCETSDSLHDTSTSSSAPHVAFATNVKAFAANMFSSTSAAIRQKVAEHYPSSSRQSTAAPLSKPPVAPRATFESSAESRSAREQPPLPPRTTPPAQQATTQSTPQHQSTRAVSAEPARPAAAAGDLHSTSSALRNSKRHSHARSEGDNMDLLGISETANVHHSVSLGQGMDLLSEGATQDTQSHQVPHADGGADLLGVQHRRDASAPAAPAQEFAPEADLLGGVGDAPEGLPQASTTQAVDLLGDSVPHSNGLDFGMSGFTPGNEASREDMLGQSTADDSGLDSFLAFASVPSTTPSSHKPRSKTASQRPAQLAPNAFAGGDLLQQAGTQAGDAASSEDSELAAKLAHLPVNARLEDVALAIGLGNMDDFDARMHKARPMWEGMQKDRPAQGDPPLRHQLWKTRVHKQIAKVILSLVELEEKERRQQEESDVGRAARPQIQKEIDAWARENMGIKRLPNLLATLHKALWEGAKWKPVGLSDVLDERKMKLIYRKAMLLTHTDKHADSPPEVKERAKMIFDYLIIAKDKVNSEKGTMFL